MSVLMVASYVGLIIYLVAEDYEKVWMMIITLGISIIAKYLLRKREEKRKRNE